MDRMEARRHVASATDKQQLIDWMNSNRAPEPYREVGYTKTFHKGSYLEWYNPVEFLKDGCGEVNDYGHGIFEEWINQADYNNLPQCFPHIRFLDHKPFLSNT